MSSRWVGTSMGSGLEQAGATSKLESMWHVTWGSAVHKYT